MFPKISVMLLATASILSVSSGFVTRPHVRSSGLATRQFGGGFGNGFGNGFGAGFGNNNGQNQGNGDNNGGNNGNGGIDGGEGLTLQEENVQDASKSNGQEGGGGEGLAESATDNANFINFCSGKDTTNGDQKAGGSCNGIPMGDIPAQNSMVSSIIVSPSPGEDIPANTPFAIQVQVANLEPGFFTNPQNTYYSAPQSLQNGRILGHTHVTVQDLGGSLTPQRPLDASTFVFFKGINDAGNGNGLLEAQVDEGLPAGFYRVCTMTSAANHQPVVMPVAQRGAQDDCTKFTVGQGNGGGNGAGGNDENNDDDGNEDDDGAGNGGDDDDEGNNNDQNNDGAGDDNGDGEDAEENEADQETVEGSTGDNDDGNQDKNGGFGGGFAGGFNGGRGQRRGKGNRRNRGRRQRA